MKTLFFSALMLVIMVFSTTNTQAQTLELDKNIQELQVMKLNTVQMKKLKKFLT